MGIASELGRDEKARANRSREYQKIYSGCGGITDETTKHCDTVSIFDPVLCECAYRWFTPPGAQVLDPFAGGSVRGVVASALGRRYWGCDLRQEQIDADEQQALELCVDPRPVYVCGDSADRLADAPAADLVFSCPPYGDLERYSDDPHDLSAMEWPAFLDSYRRIIAAACGRLNQNRFACFVVGDFRDTRGHYRGFVGETVSAFERAGLALYNDAVLVTSVGSASMRVSKQFESGRKFCKTHQNVLVFVKGDWRRAAEYCRG
jgi:DNA modification methylase